MFRRYGRDKKARPGLSHLIVLDTGQLNGGADLSVPHAPVPRYLSVRPQCARADCFVR